MAKSVSRVRGYEREAVAGGVFGSDHRYNPAAVCMAILGRAA